MLDIRPCREQDLATLTTHVPTPGQPQRHATRFERQLHGHSTFLIAWADDVPIGAGEILWRGCRAPEINQRYPDCPELNGLDVWFPERRSRGTGTALIHAAEALARERGHHQIGLGVVNHNHHAAALYLRLGYEETGCHYLDRYSYTGEHGVRHDFADPARFLVRRLQPPAS